MARDPTVDAASIAEQPTGLHLGSHRLDHFLHPVRLGVERNARPCYL
jgi:hypothetical protein